jgi:hypothetical protein
MAQKRDHVKLTNGGQVPQPSPQDGCIDGRPLPAMRPATRTCARIELSQRGGPLFQIERLFLAPPSSAVHPSSSP